MATVIIARARNDISVIGVFGPFERDELTAATSILHAHYPFARLKRYQLQPVPTTKKEG